MKITHLVKNLARQHEEMIGLIASIDSFLNKSEGINPVEVAFDTIGSFGCKGLCVVKDGRVVKQQPENFFDSNLGEFKTGIYEDIKLAKSLFGDIRFSRFVVENVGDSKIIAVFDEDTKPYIISVTDIILKILRLRFSRQINKFENLRFLLRLLYNFDKETYSHSFRVRVYSYFIAKGLGFDKKLITQIKIGAMLHDIGKLLLPLDVLKKRGKLSNGEFELIKKHVNESYEILQSFGCSDIVVQIALLHHRKRNGKGYPENSPIDFEDYVDVVAVADIMDAILSSRTYKHSKGCNILIEEIRKEKGGLKEQIIDAAAKFIASEDFIVAQRIIEKRLSKIKTVDDVRDIYESLNQLKEENISLKRQNELFKSITSELQKRYEELMVTGAKNKTINSKKALIVESYLEKFGNLKTVLIIKNNAIVEMSGKPVGIDVINNPSNQNGVYLFEKGEFKIIAVFDAIKKEPSSMTADVLYNLVR
ncbi:HD-GYP domain-containing protein [Hippea jasoniae]|uniref:HD-GYP domain-containing protein n=1 Tax=Hippea jasoniae TaxID=944479 RepID=UPI00068D6D78|nr:HD domain-containing phosphohydrolase [Hippea jasoniae]